MNTHLSQLAAQVRDLIRHSLPDGFVGQTAEPAAPAPGFNELALALFHRQFAANPAYRAICQARGVMPAQVTGWRQIPAVPTQAFKEFELTALPSAERQFVFHSSGTTGQIPSRHFHSLESLALYEASLKPWFQRHILGDGPAVPLLALTPPPEQAPHSSLVHMLDVVIREFAPKLESGTQQPEAQFFGQVNVTEGWVVDFGRLFTQLDEAIQAGRPVALLGTAFNFVHLLDALAAAGRRWVLPPKSRIMETGGYKGRSRALPREELHTELAFRLGVPRERLLTEYGMSELSSQAYDSGEIARGARTFAFPPWARSVVVSPETGREVAEGERGLLRLVDLANVWSVCAVQTEDLAVRRGTGFELLGRAAAAEPRGCSLMAAQEYRR